MKLMKSKNFKTRNSEKIGAPKMQKTQKVHLIIFSRGNRKRAHGKHPWLTTAGCDLPCKSLILAQQVRLIVIRRITRIWQSSEQGVHHVDNIPISRLCWYVISKIRKVPNRGSKSRFFARFAFCGQEWWNWWNQKISKPAILKILAPLNCKKRKRCNWFLFHVEIESAPMESTPDWQRQDAIYPAEVPFWCKKWD